MSKRLQELADIHYGKSPNEVLADDSPIPIIGTGGVYGHASRAMYDGPAVVVPRKGSLGNPQYLAEPFWPVDTTYAVIPKAGVDAKWLYYSLAAFDLTKLNEATGVPSISRDWLYKVPVGSEKYGEQRRIAEILSTVDEAIEQTEALIAKYRQIKAGLMHDLFTRGLSAEASAKAGGTWTLRPPRAQAPHLYKQSPLGWIPKEWECKSVSHLGQLGRGRVISQDYLDAHPGEYPVYSSQSLNEGIFGMIDTYDFEGDYVTWTTDGAFAGTVFFRSGKFNCTNVCGTIRPFESVDARFLAGALSGRTSRHVSYVGNPKLMNNVMAKIEVPIPVDLNEQQMIAHRIEAAVIALKSHDENLQNLRQLKHGLMQDLLSGRVRVKVAEPANS
jgi:type I restriction enzyme S subunit